MTFNEFRHIYLQIFNEFYYGRSPVTGTFLKNFELFFKKLPKKLEFI